MKNFRVFDARVLDVDKIRAAAAAGEPSGEAEIMVAVFGVPDTHVAFGNTRKQVIDRGAFRAWINETDFDEKTLPGFADHGDAISAGGHRSTLKIGKAVAARETDEGLVLKTNYNLEKQVSREAFSDLLHDPAGVQFSFGWDPDRERIQVREGVEHVTELWPTEWSQVGFGAQALAHVVSARGAGTTGSSLEAVPNAIRKSWSKQMSDIAPQLGGYAFIEEIYAGNRGQTKGHVIATTDGHDWYQVGWDLLDDGDFRFDVENAKQVEREWVVAETNGLSRGSDLSDALRTEHGRSALALAAMHDPELAIQLRAALDAEPADRALVDFYGTVFS